MGVTQLAHFVLPLLTNEPYGCFPGMASVLLLASLAWWGMWRLARGRETRSGHVGPTPRSRCGTRGGRPLDRPRLL